LALLVEGDKVTAGVAPADEGKNEAFHAVWVANYLDEPPARRVAEVFQRRGLLAFVVRKTLVEKKNFLSSRKTVGDFYLVCVGLFGARAEAEILGRRLRAQGLIANWQAIGAADPGEMARAAVQVAPQIQQSERVTTEAMKTAGRPLPPTAPAVTGQGFKRLVRGQYVGSFKDIYEARAEAERLTAAGWPASVERTSPTGGNWFRVYLAETGDRRDFEANPARLSRAKAERQAHGGVVFLLDLSGQTGKWGQIPPSESRVEASACAGYSRQGRVLTGVERVIGQIPGDSPLMVGVKSVAYAPPEGLVETVARPVRVWWTNDESELTAAKSVYGPTIFNRPQVTRSLRALKTDPRPVSLAPALDGLYEAREVPGRKVVILWSDFRWEGPDSEILAALGRLKAQYGGQLTVYVVYGDPDDKGLRLAESLAKSGSGEAAWDGCQLLADQSYFQRFIGQVLARS
jgi:cell division septation protein DedD